MTAFTLLRRYGKTVIKKKKLAPLQGPFAKFKHTLTRSEMLQGMP